MAYVIDRHQGIYSNHDKSRTGYPLVSSHYEYQVNDCAVWALLTETYQAAAHVKGQISYFFEVPPEASVIGFNAEVGARKFTGVINEKVEADQKYQAAVKAGAQAFKLDQINGEVFSISLGNTSANSLVKVHIRYVYLISSDTLEDSLRLTIPAGFTRRPGGDRNYVPVAPKSSANTNAVTINVGINSVVEGSQILNLNSLSHHANITHGFSDDSYKTMTPTYQRQRYDMKRAYVQFTSKDFLHGNFVLVWSVPKIDHARCSVEQLHPPIAGKPVTSAYALTLVSNIELEPEEHEYIFLVDSSASMSGSRSQAAASIVKLMLQNLPTQKRSSFNIYRFDKNTWPVTQSDTSLEYDKHNVSIAEKKLGVSSKGRGTDIHKALATVLGKRDRSKPRCSIIVVTDGLDWGVTAAMRTVQEHASKAAASKTLLRVFVMGVGDHVSRNMCESLARAGAGATAYISESHLQEHDHLSLKAWTMVNSINRAPIRVVSIDWGVTPTSAPAHAGASGNNLNSRPHPDQRQLGPATKGDNLPSPKGIQQAPLPGTMFWAVRSYWYAIIPGSHQHPPNVKISYSIPGSPKKILEINVTPADAGKLQHRLAARALIQALEDKGHSLTGSDKYWNECEIARLGKTYSLASSQTSFVATTHDATTPSQYSHNAPPDGVRGLHSLGSLGQESNLDFVSTRNHAAAQVQAAHFAAAMPARAARGAASSRSAEGASMPHSFVSFAAHEPVARSSIASERGEISGMDDNLSAIVDAQDSEGAFDTSIENVIFSSTGIPAVPAFLSVLEGRSYIKDRIWFAICVLAFLQKTYAHQSNEWATVQTKAEQFIKRTLGHVFKVGSGQAESILADCLDDAECYF